MREWRNDNNGNHKLRRIRALEVLAREITERGNDMEIRSSKDGLKVFEVSKRLVGVLAEEGGQNS